MKLPVLNAEQILLNLSKKSYPAQVGYAAFYSSWLGGITKEPSMMLVPIDDHMVHRGDGVFEAIKYINNKVYLLDAHLERLKSSADKISLPLPDSLKEIADIIQQTIQASGLSQALVRLFVSRGPGQFTTNPYDSIGSQLYIAITELKTLPKEKYQQGVQIGKSQIPIKSGWLPQVKSCNYLPNVLMKKESVDRKLDFTISFTADGFLGESSTENVILVNSQGELVSPHYDTILKGTTMLRLLDLAEQHKLVSTKRSQKITEQELLNAKEVMMVGTTLDVLPVSLYESKTYSVGPVSLELQKLLMRDQL